MRPHVAKRRVGSLYTLNSSGSFASGGNYNKALRVLMKGFNLASGACHICSLFFLSDFLPARRKPRELHSAHLSKVPPLRPRKTREADKDPRLDCRIRCDPGLICANCQLCENQLQYAARLQIKAEGLDSSLRNSTSLVSCRLFSLSLRKFSLTLIADSETMDH
jgi:hypothetical protein